MSSHQIPSGRLNDFDPVAAQHPKHQQELLNAECQQAPSANGDDSCKGKAEARTTQL